KEPLIWATLKKASLVLEGVDVAWRWPEGEGGAATLFEVTDGEVDVRDCTVSAAGKPREPVTLLRLRDGRTTATGRCRWQRCHVRGAEVTALDLDLPGGAVLLEGCLIATGLPTLIRMKADPTRATRLDLVQSTLVCGQKLLEVTRGSEVDRRM